MNIICWLKANDGGDTYCLSIVVIGCSQISDCLCSIFGFFWLAGVELFASPLLRKIIVRSLQWERTCTIISLCLKQPVQEGVIDSLASGWCCCGAIRGVSSSILGDVCGGDFELVQYLKSIQMIGKIEYSNFKVFGYEFLLSNVKDCFCKSKMSQKLRNPLKLSISQLQFKLLNAIEKWTWEIISGWVHSYSWRWYSSTLQWRWAVVSRVS